MNKWVAAGVCGYEVAAITTGKVPTVTALCTRYKFLAPVLLGALAVHLYWPQPRPVIVIVEAPHD